jgi:hypothetical protein
MNTQSGGLSWALLVGLLLLSGCGGSDPSQEATTLTPPPDMPPIIEPPPPDATMRTWTFHGTTLFGSIVDGTWTYEKDLAPFVRKPSGTTFYRPTAWDVRVQMSSLDLTIPNMPPVLALCSRHRTRPCPQQLESGGCLTRTSRT